MDENKERESQVSEWMKKLSTSVQRAEELQITTKNRLSSLLRDEASDEEVAQEKPLESLVPLASAIREDVRLLDNVSDEYLTMLSLLEI